LPTQHRDAAVAQVQRLRLSLVAVPQNGHGLSRQRRQLGVRIFVQLHLLLNRQILDSILSRRLSQRRQMLCLSTIFEQKPLF
jgi:hypothetical protein